MTTATFTLPAGRIGWKEYRTLRGLWLSVAALAIVVQAISALCALPGTDVPAWLFGTALAASALYAVGAAAILFAVEYEDETYSFLVGLPVTWLPVFAGKLLVAILSALAFAIGLLLTGLAISGRWPSSFAIEQLSALFGVAILESLAWGMLFSLLVSNPLLASLLAIGTMSLSTNVAVNVLHRSVTASTEMQSYLATVWLRFTVVIVVFAADVWLARRWLSGSAFHHAATAGPARTSNWTRPLGQLLILANLRPQASTELPPARRRVITRPFARLLWQSWRQSAKMMFAMLAISLALTAVAFAYLALLSHNLLQRWTSELAVAPEVALALSILFSALFGSAVFALDQRREQYRFLAEHAAQPRSVWLSRAFTWALPLRRLGCSRPRGPLCITCPRSTARSRRLSGPLIFRIINSTCDASSTLPLLRTTLLSVSAQRRLAFLLDSPLANLAR
jgi:hypothetical protein